ncbi:MAG TPA: putative quinol monooxygenase [Pirellulales bacterium]|nr:putative quinol monooxygenase [Pirellulales bacterium]
MVHVIAAIEIAPGRRDDFLESFRRLMPTVHAEAGCGEYGPTVEIDSGLSLQPPVRENVVVICEQWESLAALHTHLAAPHMTAWREEVKDLVRAVTLQVLEPA